MHYLKCKLLQNSADFGRFMQIINIQFKQIATTFIPS